MRKIWIVVAAWLVLGTVVALAVMDGRPATAGDTDSNANLPIVLKPENTPTPSATPTLAPTNTPTITPTATRNEGCPPIATPIPPTSGLVNGGFEGCWDTIVLGNQEPDGWELTWVQPGQQLWDARYPEAATAIAEMIHKLKHQLPPNEWPGAPNALILDGEATYKIFSNYNVFGSQLYQRVELPAGSWRLIVPVQLHWHENLDGKDEYTAESGAWVIANGSQSGAWAHAKQMGDRTWFYHVVEFNLTAGDSVEVVIRFKSAYRTIKDFFIDAVRIEPISAVTAGPLVEFENDQVTSRPRPLDEIPARQRIMP